MESVITYKFRIKDATTRKQLNRMAKSVNFVWNYCNEISYKAIRNYSSWLSDFDLQKLTTGCSKELGISSTTISKLCEEYIVCRKRAKKIKLNWRTDKAARKSLGWIPFKKSAIKIVDNTLIYNKQKFKFWKSRELEGDFRSGSFNQDSKGNWFVNLVYKVDTAKSNGTEYIGIDLGLKTQLTLSNGLKYNRENLTKKYEERLAKLQRTKKKKQVTNLHTKIKNIRKDWNHKTTTEMVRLGKEIYIGNVNSSKLTKTKLAKSVYDSGWYQIKSLLKYKAIRFGVTYQEVNEMFSTITCSVCNSRIGPSGLSDLGVRNWICSSCGTQHDRDINAAKNILNFGLGH